MNLKTLVAGCLIVSALGFGVAAAQETTPEPEALLQMGATAILQGADGSEAGTVTFSERDDGKVVIVVQVMNQTPGFHGFHIHTTGTCDASGDESFESAGGHLDRMDMPHGDHTGDLPVLLVNEDGTGELMVVTDRFALADLLDEDNSAVIVHANADNYGNIPERYGTPDEETLIAGDSGESVACGVIEMDDTLTAG
jgi:Cu-Zn family superoxide dismutase